MKENNELGTEQGHRFSSSAGLNGHGYIMGLQPNYAVWPEIELQIQNGKRLGRACTAAAKENGKGP